MKSNLKLSARLENEAGGLKVKKRLFPYKTEQLIMEVDL